MNRVKYYFEKERFTKVQYLLDYDLNEPISPIEGEEYHHHEARMKTYYICQHLIDHKYKQPFFKEVRYRTGRAQTTQLGDWILDLLASRYNLPANARPASYECNEHSPDLKTIMAIADAAASINGAEVTGVGFVHPLPIEPFNYTFTINYEIDIAVEAYAALAMQMRMALLNSEMKAVVKSFRRNSKERRDHLMSVANDAWKRHSSILLIRLDWGFGKTRFLQPYHCMGQAEFESCLAEVCGYRNQMLSILAKMFGSSLAFYAWKIECGDSKGIHMHWLLAVNGSKHQDRVNVGLRIQKEWDATIGNGQTYTFNVNGMRNAERSGLRVINYNDPELWDIVGRYVDYFLKVDYTLKLRMPKGMRSFGCSKLRTSLNRKPGPKRKHTMSGLPSTRRAVPITHHQHQLNQGVSP